MIFNEEEKEVFEIKDEEYLDPSIWFNSHLLNIYCLDENKVLEHNFYVTLNFIKKMILEISEKNGYGIVGDECDDIDSILKEIIKHPEYDDDNYLADFNPELYKNPEALDNYFYSKTKDLSWDDLDYLKTLFEFTNDGFRSYFASKMDKFTTFPVVLYYDLLNNEQESIDSDDDTEWLTDDNYSDSEDNEPIIIEEADDEWPEEWIDTMNNPSINDGSVTYEINKESLLEFIKYINSISELIKYRKLGYDVLKKLVELADQKKLEYFYSDEEFATNFDQIMSHDTSKYTYYFHGTQCVEDAESIIDEGLGMVEDSLSTTAYPEFTKDDVLLYERGFGGEIGHDAIVIIAVPKNNEGREVNVITPLDPNTKIDFCPSGLQGLNCKLKYIILPENIVGFVDKMNRKIVFNPKFNSYGQGSTGKKME